MIGFLFIVSYVGVFLIGVAVGALFVQPVQSVGAGDDPDPGERKAA